MQAFIEALRRGQIIHIPSKIKGHFLVTIILSLLLGNSFFIQPVNTGASDHFFTLVAKTNTGGTRPDYLNLLKQQLDILGINVDIVLQDWPSFVMELIAFRDFDICYVALVGGGADPDFTGVYDENGSLNLFGYDTSMDYNETLGTGLNEWYMKQGTSIIPPYSEERIQHYWAWEQHLMDKICPLIPTFVPKSYEAHWNNLKGYNISEHFTQSWGKMYFNSTHQGQESMKELVRADNAWSNLHPFFQDDQSSEFITSTILEPLIWFDSGLHPWTHLATGWEMLNDTHFRVHIREGVKWQPDPEGNFTNEYLDARDVYFTYQAILGISSDLGEYFWIKHMKIIDNYTVDFYIDGDPNTSEDEVYSPFFSTLSLPILPEHYLNQSQLIDGVTPDIGHPSWDKYSAQCFGTSILQLESFTEYDETTLKIFDDCWWLNETLTQDPALQWKERFGDKWELEKLRIKIIPEPLDALDKFIAGKIDLLAITQFSNKRKQLNNNPNFNIQSEITFYLGFFGFNMRKSRNIIGNRDPCPSDPTMSVGLAVRKAISYAVNREEINNVVHSGEQLITDYPIYLKMGIWCNPNIIRYNYDYNKAREYLQKAGFYSDCSSGTVSTLKTKGYEILLVLPVLLTIIAVMYVYKKKRTR
ncbi:MAG: hypothetical protein GF308_09260 [Candidatus Heimdallarchaeota archaeon]|nr:hypothetical protein [Candidatus Heimdallarchaeota archaeon]